MGKHQGIDEQGDAVVSQERLTFSANSLSLNSEGARKEVSDRIKQGEDLFNVDTSHEWDVTQEIREKFTLKPDKNE